MAEFSDEDLDSLELFPEYSNSLLNFAVVSCIIFMLLGIPGNLITIISLARYKKVRNATAIFIINMSFADLLYCCIVLPLTISTFWTRKWILGVFMCRFFPFARFVLSGVALFNVQAITINRYIMISHPRLYTKLYTTRNLGYQVACIWLFSIASLIPTWVGAWGEFGMVPKESFCAIRPVNEYSPEKFLFISAFIIPFITISICYARIFFLVRKATARSRGTVRRKVEREDSSLPTSIPEQVRNSVLNDKVTRKSQVPPENPRIQSLRPPSNTQPKVSIAPDELSSASSFSNFTRAINLRKSQLLNIAPTSKDRKLLTMITAIVFTFFVLHLPITIIKVISGHDPTWTIWSYLLRYLTICINPIIYVVMSHEYRKAYKKIMVFPSCKTKSCLPR